MPFQLRVLRSSLTIWRSTWMQRGRCVQICRCGGICSASMCTQRREIVQSNSGNGLRSILDQYADHELAQTLRRNGHGNYYRHQQKLWPSSEALERELTELHYSPVERTPLAMLPQRSRPQRSLVCEGRGATALLERTAEELVSAAASDFPSIVSEASADAGDDVDLMMELALSDQSIGAKVLSESDISESMLASAKERARDIIGVDLSVNSLALAPRDTEMSSSSGVHSRPSARDKAGASWESLGLDAALSAAATAFLGPVPTRLQTRLLPALLNEDHNDVIFNGVTGSGKTSALLLVLLQGIRSEAAGMNVIVATNSMNAMRLHDAIRAICRNCGLGGAVVDRPVDDFSWLFLGTFREDHDRYHNSLRRSLFNPHGPVRLLITTADAFCELLFEKKMEFEGFGYLRRVYVDDIGAQIPLIPESAPLEVARERLRNPLAAELLLGTLHQLPGPHIRSVLQLGLVSADVEGRLKDHLLSLCVKPAAHTVVLSPVRVPSTVHCLFSAHLPHECVYAHLVKVAWNARHAMPGRAVVFIKNTDDVLAVRRRLRGLGMKAKVFSEVYADGAFQEKWKFLVLKESEAFSVDIPLVSHVFMTFLPTSWQSYLHMCGRTGRLGNVGWAYSIVDRREAGQMRSIAEDLSVDFIHHVVDADLQQVDAAEIDRLTRAPALYGLDPQYAVQQHYEVQAENPDMAYRSREFFSKPAVRQFQMEDYTPTPVLQRRFRSAQMLARDVERNPSMAVEMQKAGFLDQKFRPTRKLKAAVDAPNSKDAPAPFGK